MGDPSEHIYIIKTGDFDVSTKLNPLRVVLHGIIDTHGGGRNKKVSPVKGGNGNGSGGCTTSVGANMVNVSQFKWFIYKYR